MTNEKKQVLIPDRPEARDLAFLASHQADLVEAKQLVTKAMTYAYTENAEERLIYRALAAHAVVTYWRCFGTSNVRKSLDTVVPVPAALADIHETFRHIRNRTVAHSESKMHTTYTLADVEHDGTTATVTAVGAATMHSAIPYQVLGRLLVLIDALDSEIKALLAPAKQALLATISGDAADLWKNDEQLRGVIMTVDEWDPEPRRSQYPDSPGIPFHLFGH